MTGMSSSGKGSGGFFAVEGWAVFRNSVLYDNYYTWTGDPGYKPRDAGCDPFSTTCAGNWCTSVAVVPAKYTSDVVRRGR